MTRWEATLYHLPSHFAPLHCKKTRILSLFFGHRNVLPLINFTNELALVSDQTLKLGYTNKLILLSTSLFQPNASSTVLSRAFVYQCIMHSSAGVVLQKNIYFNLPSLHRGDSVFQHDCVLYDQVNLLQESSYVLV